MKFFNFFSENLKKLKNLYFSLNQKEELLMPNKIYFNNTRKTNAHLEEMLSSGISAKLIEGPQLYVVPKPLNYFSEEIQTYGSALTQSIGIVSDIQQFCNIAKKLEKIFVKREDMITIEDTIDIEPNLELVSESDYDIVKYLQNVLKTSQNYAEDKIVEFFFPNYKSEKKSPEKLLEEKVKEYESLPVDYDKTKNIIRELSNTSNIFLFGRNLLQSSKYNKLDEKEKKIVKNKFYNHIPNLLKFLKSPKEYLVNELNINEKYVNENFNSKINSENLKQNLAEYFNLQNIRMSLFGEREREKKSEIVVENKNHEQNKLSKNEWKEILLDFSYFILGEEYGSSECVSENLKSIANVQAESSMLLQAIYKTFEGGEEINPTLLNIFWPKYISELGNKNSSGNKIINLNKESNVGDEFINSIINEYKSAKKRSITLSDLVKTIPESNIEKKDEYKQLIYQTSMTVLYGSLLELKRRNITIESNYMITNYINTILQSSGLPLLYEITNKNGTGETNTEIEKKQAIIDKINENLKILFCESKTNNHHGRISRSTIDYIFINGVKSDHNQMESLRTLPQNAYTSSQKNNTEIFKLLFNSDLSTVIFNFIRFLSKYKNNALEKLKDEVKKKKYERFYKLNEHLALATLNSKFLNEQLFTIEDNSEEFNEFKSLFKIDENETPYVRDGLINGQIIDLIRRPLTKEDLIVKNILNTDKNFIGIDVNDDEYKKLLKEGTLGLLQTTFPQTHFIKKSQLEEISKRKISQSEIEKLKRKNKKINLSAVKKNIKKKKKEQKKATQELKEENNIAESQNILKRLSKLTDSEKVLLEMGKSETQNLITFNQQN